MRRQFAIWLSAVMSATLAVAPVNALELSARDALTGAPVQATARVHDAQGSVRQTFVIDGVRRTVALDAGSWQVHTEAAGYRSFEFALDGSGSTVTLLLEPLAEPSHYSALAARAAERPQGRWVQGYVRRAVDGTAMANAEIQFEGRRTLSLADGYFELELAELGPPNGVSTLFVHGAGFAEYQRNGFVPAPGVQRVLVSLGADTPAQAEIEVGALDRVQGVVAADSTQATVMPDRAPLPPDAISLALPLSPPQSIRVGYADAACTTSCCTASCDNTCVLPLETYVRRGLDSEWIASWNTQSLRAGSLAYRSYGAWRVAHPINANFDICSSACCQVNDAGTHSSTDAAIARTPGLLLTRNGSESASTEYSAENNSWDDPNDGLSCSNVDLSCGDGFAGSPSAGWPCLPDAVGAGRGCFGHGRGMSQWGTQRWALHASAPRWVWIVDHYYNDNGNENGAGTGQRTAQITSPVSLSGLGVNPSVIQSGESIQITATASNAAGAAHAHLLIGASLYKAGQGYVDDASNDTPLNLATGNQGISRAFVTPPTLVDGSWDVLLSLYLDVDENGTISAMDLPMALIRVNGALQVIDDRIFFDGFEAAP